ncbi:DeoR/GlpR family DNA-binding transcription regulator [Micropruina sonneratiae]|uniref:DeoR/GlpR family DNA-binding transcription regulator n=1 Tax=Micropruina sonneratiae TaxID=2986940 RepID=UPI002225D483|nr:DeoR/GlpR family DNA-binding transcription regulator [Micropruina sp. KQZ13P-5]MCW3158957.1 DeoR/GlpR family DNA-binding transcription regulator [Micropruina sp. KQZ13P-5]
MYAEERQRTIVNLALRYDRVSVTELAGRFGVTTETVRRDLDVLDRRGILRRVHGGAVPAENVRLVETAVADREPAFSAQKARIAQAALAFLPTGEGSTVLIDSGTTTARFAAAMGAHPRTVVTNSVPIASQLALSQRGDVHLLGGRVRGLTQATVGGETVEALGRLRCDVAFLGTNGLTAEHGFSTPDPDEAAVKRAMVHGSRRRVVLADSSKIGVTLLVSFAALNEIHVLVTDAGLAEADRQQLVNAGLEVVTA